MIPKHKAKLHDAKAGEELSSLRHKQRGRPLLLGKEFDGAVCRHLKTIRAAGGVVSRSITKATAVGILKACQPSHLSVHNGDTFLSNSWCNSIHKRINYCKRKSTIATRKVPEDFDNMKSTFLEQIKAKIVEHDINSIWPCAEHGWDWTIDSACIFLDFGREGVKRCLHYGC